MSTQCFTNGWGGVGWGGVGVGVGGIGLLLKSGTLESSEVF